MDCIFEKLIDRITSYFKNELSLDENQTAVVKYSLSVYLTTAIGYLALIVTAWPLGVLGNTLAAAITASLLRIFSGGAHASRPENCILMGALVFPVSGLAAKYFSFGIMYFDNFFILITGIWTIWAVYRFAPADTPGKPLSTQKQRRVLRRWSFGIVICWTGWAVFASAGIFKFSLNILFASALGMVWQGFSLTPTGYGLVRRLDQTVENLRGGCR